MAKSGAATMMRIRCWTMWSQNTVRRVDADEKLRDAPRCRKEAPRSTPPSCPPTTGGRGARALFAPHAQR